ncbi:MAG: DUF4040 domain-containing protein [Deltaproteobacteria bacterium]|nr:DUF4040 domain-containing protein [Deltaproteobacteria bacterium]
MEIFLIIFAVLTVASALIAVATTKKAVSILAAGVMGLFASIVFIFLAAPDVAMTEAAIGSGLTTFIFFFALNRVKSDRAQGGADD